jgi:hypothetical protein
MNKSIYIICLMFSYCCFAHAAVVTKNTVTVIKEQQDNKKRAITLSLEQPLKEIANQAEIFLVSGYEPTVSTASVEIDRPNSRVVLILTSNEKVRWEITATPLTRVVAVITSGDKAPTLITNF